MTGKSGRIIEAGQIASMGAAEIRSVCLPVKNALFAGRARRLRHLGEDHPMSGYLQLIADVADAQQDELDAFSGFGLPDPAHLEQCGIHRMPPLNVQTHKRNAEWRNILRRMLRQLASDRGGAPGEILRSLETQSDDFYEAQASKLLAGTFAGVDPAAGPLVGAALQVYFSGLTAALGEKLVQEIDVKTVCPSCASRPMASIIRSSAAAGGHRYLSCGICMTEWHYVRIKCSNCEFAGSEKISYRSIEGGSQAIQAEACENCGTYLKLFNMEKDPQVEPVADDLATAALDLLMAETGLLRNGLNVMLIQGESGD